MKWVVIGIALLAAPITLAIIAAARANDDDKGWFYE